MHKNTHETALNEGQLANLMGAGAKAFALIANKLGPERAHYLASKENLLQETLLRALLAVPLSEKNFFLKEVSKLSIPMTSGDRILAHASDLFSFIDPDFVRWNTLDASEPTKSCFLSIYDTTGCRSIPEIFRSLGFERYQRNLTQHQIIAFIENYPSLFKTPDQRILFLFGVVNRLYVACVTTQHLRKPSISIYPFQPSYTLDKHDLIRIVVLTIN